MRLASRGLRDMDEGLETIQDAGELAVLRSQARAVGRSALITTLAVTAVAVALP